MAKDFKDFISSLNKDSIEEVIGLDRKVDFSLSNNGMQEYTNFVIGKNFEITLNLIELYHNWLKSDK